MALEYLFAGFAVFWAGIFVYVLLLQARLRALQRDIGHLEERVAESEASATPAAALGTPTRTVPASTDAPEGLPPTAR